MQSKIKTEIRKYLAELKRKRKHKNICVAKTVLRQTFYHWATFPVFKLDFESIYINLGGFYIFKVNMSTKQSGYIKQKISFKYLRLPATW